MHRVMGPKGGSSHKARHKGGRQSTGVGCAAHRQHAAEPQRSMASGAMQRGSVSDRWGEVIHRVGRGLTLGESDAGAGHDR